jgi:hypothetical protein
MLTLDCQLRKTKVLRAQPQQREAFPLRSADIELQSRIELRVAAPETAAPKPDLDAKVEKTTILYHFVNRIKGK